MLCLDVAKHEGARMSQRSFILFGALLVALLVLGELYGSPQPMNIYDFFGWLKG